LNSIPEAALLPFADAQARLASVARPRAPGACSSSLPKACR